MDVIQLRTEMAQMADRLSPQLSRIRQHLHQNPEIGYQEFATTAYLMDLLKPSKLAILYQENRSGFWAERVHAPDDWFLALRADIDALPMQEQTAAPYASSNAGLMHGCGHDAHMTILAGAALVLDHFADEIPGNVRFIFQPAEEVTPGGAIEMIGRGVLNRVRAIIALHSDPRIAAGQVGVKRGPVMASTDIFKLKIIGKGAHAANPHKSIDPILISAQVIIALNHLVSREIDPVTPAVLTVTRVNGGTAVNIIPCEVEIWGTLRALDNQTRKFLQKRADEISGSICRMHGATCEWKLDQGAPPVVNDGTISDLVFQAAGDILKPENALQIDRPEMGAEDFAWYLEQVPGAIFRLGTNGRAGTDYELHHPKFDIDETALAVGVKVLCWTVARYFIGEMV